MSDSDTISLLCSETDNLCFDDLEAIDDLSPQTDFDNLVGVQSEPLIGLIPMQSDEVLFSLFEKETELLPASDFLQRLTSGDPDLGDIRKEAADYISQTHALYGFGVPSACLAINYLDRFLSFYEFPGETYWSVQLLSLACLSLAAKVDEVAGPTIYFQAEVIKRMELLVLTTLKWRMHACTPFSFLEYFLRKFRSEDMLPSGSLMYGSLIYKSSQFIINTLKGIEFLEFRPSEISAAVAICVTGESEELDIDKAISGVMHFEKVKLMKCIEMIKDLTSEAENTDVTNGAVPIAPAPAAPHSPIGVLDAASLSYKSDERTSVSNPSSSHSGQDNKRRKLD